MPKEEYMPDEIDEDWLAGNSHEPLNPSHDSYDARMKWRHEQTAKERNKPKQGITITWTGIAITLIFIIIAYVIFFVIPKSPDTQPNASPYSGCASDNPNNC